MTKSPSLGQSARGRPLKFGTPEEMQKKIDAYFRNCDPHWKMVTTWVYQRDDKGNIDYTKPMVKERRRERTEQIPYTITGLALALGTSRETLVNYEERDNFFDTVKAAKMKCQNYAELHLFRGKNATGAIFSLKNNYGWVDRREEDGEQHVIIETRKHKGGSTGADSNQDD